MGRAAYDLFTQRMADRLQELSAFVRTAETGSFSRVARELGVSQPSVSRRRDRSERAKSSHVCRRSWRAIHSFGSISSSRIATRTWSPKGSTSRYDSVRWRTRGSVSARWAELRAWWWRRRLTWRVEERRKPLPSYRATIASWVLVSRVEAGGASLRLAR